MQFIDLSLQQKRIRDRLEKNIADVLNHGQYIMGPEIQLLEEKLANYVDVGFAIACGAALSHLERAQAVDFRSDFMPYQGKKVRLQKAMNHAAVFSDPPGLCLSKSGFFDPPV